MEHPVTWIVYPINCFSRGSELGPQTWDMEKVLCQGSIGTGFGGRGQGRRSSVPTILVESGRQEGCGLVKDRTDIQDRTGGGSGVATSRKEAPRRLSNPASCPGWHSAHLLSLSTCDTSVHCCGWAFSHELEANFCKTRKVLPAPQLLLVYIINEALLETTVSDSVSQPHQADQDPNNHQYNVLKQLTKPEEGPRECTPE